MTRDGRPLVYAAVELLVAVGLASAVEALLVNPYRIPSASMEPTLAIRQRILVNRVGAGLRNLRIGEIT